MNAVLDLPVVPGVDLGPDGGHESVLLAELVEALKPGAGQAADGASGIFVDATFGRGGHSRALLGRLGVQARLIALDRDPEAIAWGRAQLRDESRLELVQAAFDRLGAVLAERQLSTRVNGVMFDLGVSSPQLDQAERGFSFMKDGPLDLRMDPTQGMSAADYLREVSEAELAQVLWELGEERYSRRIARAVVHDRKQTPFTRTVQLAALIGRVVPNREPGKHPATRSFLALRLKVNGELEQVRAALPQALEALAPGGRLAVISFHSLEDRIVKNFMRDEAGRGEAPPWPQARRVRLKLIGKPVKPGAEECARNPRARSAVLRVAERVVESVLPATPAVGWGQV